MADNSVRFPSGSGSGALARSVLLDALAGVELAADVRAALASNEDWRAGYPAVFRTALRAGLRAPQDAVAIARRGLDSLDARLGLDLAASGRLPAGEPIASTSVVGSARPGREVAIPYRGELLSGTALDRRLDDWLACGTIEPAAAEAVRTVQAHPQWLDLSDLTFVLIGAGAQMGPLAPLLAWGADVVAIDVPRPAIWSRMHAAANASAGCLHMITADVVAKPGVVGLALAELDTRGRQMVLGNYVYAPGASYLLASAAVDAVIAHVLRARDGDVTLAALGSPTEVYAVSADVVDAARAAARRLGPLRALGPAARFASRGRAITPQFPASLGTADLGAAAGVVDSLVKQQGPNYALAKQIQRWRMAAARTDGVAVSYNVAPPSRTRSVLSNRLLAAAYDGANHFGVEVFDPPTSNALMATMLVHDLRNPIEHDHPWQYESAAAAHGGLWRQGYVPRTVLGLSVGFGARSLLRR